MHEKGDTQICRAVVTADPVEAASRPMYLIVVHGGTPGAMLRLEPEVTRLGRSHENSVRFSDLGVSRRHATIVGDAQGVVWLNDMDSTNGTFLNGTRLQGHLPYRLQNGDRIRFGGSVVVKFVLLDACDEEFQRELFERTVRDPLTGLYNRAFFLDQVGPLAEQGGVRRLGLAVLMLDIDHFKRVNDTYGHDAGDAVLREVAVVLRESTRTEDLVARYGGEEFVVALPAAAPDQATDRAERIRANLAARPIAVPGRAIRVTASLGLAFAQAGRVWSLTSLVSAADACLYQAKNAGRNRVVFRVDAQTAHGLAADRVTPPSGGS